jgi:hypothetical protein
MGMGRVSRQSRLLHELVEEHGLAPEHYALFFVTGEGQYLPRTEEAGEPVEEASGYVLDEQGRVYFFWLGWDATRERPAMVEWRQEPPEPEWFLDEEYRRARRQMGLPVQ